MPVMFLVLTNFFFQCTSTLPPKGPAPAVTPSVFHSLPSKRFLTWFLEQIYVYLLNMNVLDVDLSGSES